MRNRLFRILLASLLNLPRFLFAGETDDADGCPMGEIMTESGCQRFAYERRSAVEFEETPVTAERQGPWLQAIFDTRLPCDARYQNLEEYTACIEVKTPEGFVPCPQGQIAVLGRCRDPQELADIPSHQYTDPETKITVKIIPVQDPNQAPNEEAAALGTKLRKNFEKTSQCPTTLDDVALIELIAQETHNSSRLSVDVSPLIAPLQQPQNARPSATLALDCGYHEGDIGWHQRSFYCIDHDNCFNQGHSRNGRVLPHNTWLYQLQALDSGFFKTADPGNPYWDSIDPETFRYAELLQILKEIGTNLDEIGRLLEEMRQILEKNTQASSQQPDTPEESLDFFEAFEMRLIPLGSGVFIKTINKPGKPPYCQGLVFAPIATKKVQTKSLPLNQLNDQASLDEWEHWLISEGELYLNEDEFIRLRKALDTAKTHAK